MPWVKLLRWSKVLATAGALSFAVTLTASTEGGAPRSRLKKQILLLKLLLLRTSRRLLTLVRTMIMWWC